MLKGPSKYKNTSSTWADFTVVVVFAAPAVLERHPLLEPLPLQRVWAQESWRDEPTQFTGCRAKCGQQRAHVCKEGKLLSENHSDGHPVNCLVLARHQHKLWERQELSIPTAHLREHSWHNPVFKEREKGTPIFKAFLEICYVSQKRQSRSLYINKRSNSLRWFSNRKHTHQTLEHWRS